MVLKNVKIGSVAIIVIILSIYGINMVSEDSIEYGSNKTTIPFETNIDTIMLRALFEGDTVRLNNSQMLATQVFERISGWHVFTDTFGLARDTIIFDSSNQLVIFDRIQFAPTIGKLIFSNPTKDRLFISFPGEDAFIIRAESEFEMNPALFDTIFISASKNGTIASLIYTVARGF